MCQLNRAGAAGGLDPKLGPHSGDLGQAQSSATFLVHDANQGDQTGAFRRQRTLREGLG